MTIAVRCQISKSLLRTILAFLDLEKKIFLFCCFGFVVRICDRRGAPNCVTFRYLEHISLQIVLTVNEHETIFTMALHVGPGIIQRSSNNQFVQHLLK